MTRSRHLALVGAALAAAVALPGRGASQSTGGRASSVGERAFELSIPSIMRGPEVVGERPRDVRWTDDSRWVYFRWKPAGQRWSDRLELYRVSADGGEPERLEQEAADSLAALFAPGHLSPDRRWRVSSVDGDVMLVDRSTMAVRRLTETTESESSPRFSSDGSSVFFVRGDNLFRIGLTGGAIRQVTDFRSGPEPEEPAEPEGHDAFLRSQQEELFEHVRTEKRADEERKGREERLEKSRPVPHHLPSGDSIVALDPSPDGAYVAVTSTSTPSDAQRVVVPDWVTRSGYTEDIETRPKVGDEQAKPRVGIVIARTGEVTWLELGRGEGGGASGGRVGRGSPGAVRDGGGERAGSPTLESLEPDPDGSGSNVSKEAASGAPDPNVEGLARAEFVGWSDSGAHGLVFAVDDDYKEWRLYSLETATGELTLLDSLHDEAWVDGPCFGECMGWIPGTERAFYVSERTGFAHLYIVEADGSAPPQALTSGVWEVRSVEIPEDRSSFLVRTSEASAFDVHPYRLSFDGSERTRLVRGRGHFEATLSPSGERMALVISHANRPPELFLADAVGGAEPAQVTVSPSAEWLAFPWIEPEIVSVPAADGALVPARIYRPSDLGAESNGAGVIFVHGAGYLQNVHNGWSGYYREYMFHHLLAAHGYTVLDLDYRGSAGHGRDWRTATYRWMGGKDLSDQVDGARYLTEREGVDPARIGIYGGSYGGFITLMALFTEPDVFEAGAALRSVTDWAHYNHWYTSRILNQPQDDEEAYERSSPIYFADGLQGHLLIAHGMVDTNVHFSDVVRLAQRLIELGKENWEMAVYPVENHGFVEPTSWTDEYRRIFALFERALGSP